MTFAVVYNCRSANTWSNDLALTATHFTKSRLTFGILFGCTEEIELEVLNRISKAKEQAFHPILLPGIFAELERERMVEVVESSIDQIEEAIMEMDNGASSGSEPADSSLDDSGYPGGPRAARRSVWLNTTFLRNRLQIWKTQMSKMVKHVDEISAEIQADVNEEAKCVFDDSRWSDQTLTEDMGSDLLHMGGLIKDRLKTIIEEFEEKMEDCTMRVDGMAMATQWVRRISIHMHLTSLLIVDSLMATRTWISHRLLVVIPVR